MGFFLIQLDFSDSFNFTRHNIFLTQNSSIHSFLVKGVNIFAVEKMCKHIRSCSFEYENTSFWICKYITFIHFRKASLGLCSVIFLKQRDGLKTSSTIPWIHTRTKLSEQDLYETPTRWTPRHLWVWAFGDNKAVSDENNQQTRFCREPGNEQKKVGSRPPTNLFRDIPFEAWAKFRGTTVRLRIPESAWKP